MKLSLASEKNPVEQKRDAHTPDERGKHHVYVMHRVPVKGGKPISGYTYDDCHHRRPGRNATPEYGKQKG